MPKELSFAEAFAAMQAGKRHDEPERIPSENPEQYADLLMPTEGYFDHIGATRAKRARERVSKVIEHIKEPPPADEWDKPGGRALSRTFGVPGASLQNAIEFPPKDWKNTPRQRENVKAGLKGEELTAKALAKWADDKPDVVICHSVSIPRKEGDYMDTAIEVEAHYGEDEQDLKEEKLVLNGPDEDTGLIDSPDTDHVVVIGSNVWIIDSKMWASGKDLDDPRANYQFRGPRAKKKLNFAIIHANSARPRYVRMKQALHLWRSYLGGGGRVFVRGIINIHPRDIDNPEHKLDPTQPEKIPGVLKFLRYDEWYKAPFKPTDSDKFIELLDEFYDDIPDDRKGYIDVGLVTLVARTPVKVRDRQAEFFGDALKGFI